MNNKRMIALAAVLAVAALLITGLCINNNGSTADGEKTVTFNLVGDSFAYTIDEGAEPAYITTSGAQQLTVGDHTVNVYKVIAGEPATYSKLRTKTISVKDDTSITISPVNVILGNAGFALTTDYTLTAKLIDYYGTAITGTNNAYVDGQTITYSVFTDETLSVLVKPKNTNDYKPAEILTMGGSAAKNFNVTLDSSLVMRITVPSDAVVSLTVDNNRNAGDYTRVPAEVNTDMTTSTVRAFNLAKTDSHYLRISGENYFTTCMLISGNAAYPRQYIVDESALTIVSGIRDRSYVNTDLEAYYKYNQANIVTNINYQNFLNMSVNDTKTLEANKSIMVCQPEGNLGGLIGSSIYTMEPDFNYKVINFDGTASDVVSINNGVLKAEKEGTAVVLVGYDAFGYYSFVSSYACNYALNTGIWSEYTDAFVVHVGTNGSISTNMTVNEWLNIDLNPDGTYKYETTPMTEAATAGKSAGNFLDSEIDVLYYLEGQAGYSYTFTPESGCTVTVYNPVFVDGKLTSYAAGTVTEDDGTFTVLMTEGRNIIKVEKSGNVAYQVATVKKTTLTVTYEYKTEEGKLYPGDVVTVQFGALDSPQSRIYIYNTHTYIALFDLDDEGNLLNKYTDAPTGTVIGAYNFASDANAHKLTFTIPDSAAPGSHTLEGAFIIKGFGSPLGNHHGAGVTAAHNSAPGLNAILGKLPGVTFTVADYGTIIYDTTAAVETGTSFTASKTITTSTKGALVDTLYVKKGDTITYTVNGNSAIYTGYVSGSCPVGWTWNMPGGNGSKQVVYTFEATVSSTHTISFAWGNNYAFSVKVVVIEGDTATGKQLIYGSGTIADANIADGFKIKDGKTVVRWNDKDDFTGNWYNIGDTIELATGTKNLYGQVAVPTVTYNVPNGTFSLKNGEETVTSGSTVPAGTTLTLSYTLDEEHVLALFMLNKQILLNSTTTTYTFVVNSNISITSAAAYHYHFYLVDSTGEDMSFNGWYDSVATDPVIGLSNVLDMKGIKHGEMKNSPSGYWFTNDSIKPWSVGSWASDGNYYNPNYGIWKWNATDKWQLSNGFGTESDVVYVISHEKYIDVSANGAAMANAGVTSTGGVVDVSGMKAGYDASGKDWGYIQLAPRDKTASAYADLKFGPSITVTWKNYDGTVVKTDSDVIYGTTPAYTGTTPVRIATADTFYTFKGWAPAFAQIYADIIYTAEYTETVTVCAVTWTEDEIQKTEYYDSIVNANNAATGKTLVILRNISLTANISLKANTVIEDGAVLEAPNGKTLTLPKNMTLTINDGGQFKGIGTGKITNNGSIVNNGTLTVQKSSITGAYSGDGAVVATPYFDNNNTVNFTSGTGTIVHTETKDTVTSASANMVVMTLIVTGQPTGSGWDNAGTAAVKTFSTIGASAKVAYVPSYLVSSVVVNGVTYYSYYKVTEMQSDAITKINAKTIGIVLPAALRDVTLGASVTKITSTQYTDTLGNVYCYDITETSPVYYNGSSSIQSFEQYANAAENADARFCEQGAITKIILKGEVSPTKNIIAWSKNPMVSSDTIIGSTGTGSGYKIIGAVVTNDAFTVTASKITFNDGVAVEVDGAAVLVNATEFNGVVIKSGASLTVKNKPGTASGAQLAITKGHTLTIETGAELLLKEYGYVSNKGTVDNNGIIKQQRNKVQGTITGNGTVEAIPFFNVGDTARFASGTGTVQHTSGWDKATFNTKSGTTMNFTVLTASDSMGDWSKYGTAELTSLVFQDNADLIYIPSFIIGKMQIGDVTYYTYVKVTSISADALAQINEKTINVVLPQALKNTKFGESVTVLTGSQYVDSYGNTYYYDVNETSPIWFNGYTTYTVYAYAVDGDVRYCEQGTVTKIVFADGLTATTTALSTWGSSPLASSSTWIGSSSPSYGDIIGLAVTNDFDLSDSEKYEFNIEVTVNGKSAVDKPIIVSDKISFENVIASDVTISGVGENAEISCYIRTAATYCAVDKVKPVSGTVTIVLEGSEVTCTGKYTGSINTVSRVMSAIVTGISSSDVIVDLTAYGGNNAIPAGKIILTYSAYVEGNDGVKLCPCLTVIADVDANEKLVSVPTEKAAVTCSVSYGYDFLGKTYFTPVAVAKAPSVGVLDIEADCGVSFNGNVVSAGDFVLFDTYEITIDSESSFTVNGKEWGEGSTLFYYGQKIVIAKV